jgi:DNA-binding MarR family transcriptional regulator
MPRVTPKVSRDLALEIGRLIARSRRRVWDTAAIELERVGQPMFSWQLLSHLARSGTSSSQRELAIFTAQHPAGVSRSLNELERAGLVRRQRDAHDRRKLLVAVTPAGKARYRRILPLVAVAIDRVLAPLSEAERLALTDLLGKLADG